MLIRVRALSLLLLVFIGTALCLPANALTLKHKIEGIDPVDVDLLIAHFGRLVDAIEKFDGALDERVNSIIDRIDSSLEFRIEQAAKAMDSAVTCAVDQFTVQSSNAVEKLVPKIAIFRSSAEKACDTTTIVPDGINGTRSRFEFEHCVLQELIARDSRSTRSVNLAYSDLTEVANAAYCRNRNRKGSTDHASTKAAYGRAAILTDVYSEMSKWDGCEVLSADSFFVCTKLYAQTQFDVVNTYNAIDRKSIDTLGWNQSIADLEPASASRGFVRKEPVLTRRDIERFESLLRYSLVSLNLAVASKEQRRRDYQRARLTIFSAFEGRLKELELSNSDLIKKYVSCADGKVPCTTFQWPEFSSSDTRRLHRACRDLVKNPMAAGIAKRPDRRECSKAYSRVRDREGAISEMFHAYIANRRRAASAVLAPPPSIPQ